MLGVGAHRLLPHRLEVVAQRERGGGIYAEVVARAFARLVLHGILAYRGDAIEAVAVGEENIALCREHGLPQEAEWSRSFQGSALITLGRYDEGLALLRDSVAVQEQLKTHLARPMFLAILADGLRQADRVDEGLATVNQGFAFVARTAEGGYGPPGSAATCGIRKTSLRCSRRCSPPTT